MNLFNFLLKMPNFPNDKKTFLDNANKLLLEARKLYKKSCILSASKKIIVEIRGSEFLEMPLYDRSKLLFSGKLSWLKQEVCFRMKETWKKEGLFKRKMENKLIVW